MGYGMACSPREGEPISGDTCTVQTGLPGQVIMSLSDGMGSGRSASEDSEKVIELTQRLLETGFSARSALKLVNTVLLLAGTEQNPATIDLCCIDLGTGVLEAMKLGAVPTFILGREGVEFLEAGGLPMGIVQNAEPVLMSRKMWDGEKIIMISDGILEAMPGEHKEETFMEFVSNLSGGNPQELAEQILAFAQEHDPAELLMPVDALFAQHPALIVTLGQTEKLKHGATIRDWHFADGTYRVYSETGEFLLLGTVKRQVLTTVKSFFEV